MRLAGWLICIPYVLFMVFVAVYSWLVNDAPLAMWGSVCLLVDGGYECIPTREAVAHALFLLSVPFCFGLAFWLTRGTADRLERWLWRRTGWRRSVDWSKSKSAKDFIGAKSVVFRSGHPVGRIVERDPARLDGDRGQ